MRHGLLFSAAMAVMIICGDAQLAQGAASDSGGMTTKTCKNKCLASYNYCKKHQADEMNCDDKLSDCYEWCLLETNPATQSPGGAIQRSPGKVLPHTPAPGLRKAPSGPRLKP